MKKIIASVLTVALLLSCFGMVAQAKVGDWKGTALHTDIVVYINNFAVPSYAVNGQSVIVAEDLRNFGFDVTWNNWNRSLTITRNADTVPTPMHVIKDKATGSKFTDILETDISVWAGGRRITSYAMKGYTMIPVEELTMFGEVNWVQSERALKMWVDGLGVCDEKQTVSTGKYYPGTYAPDYGWFAEAPCLREKDGYNEFLRVYISDAASMQEYINFIERNGWYLEDNSQNGSGTWFAGYYNPNLRIGIALSEKNGIVQVQVETNMGGWSGSFQD